MKAFTEALLRRKIGDQTGKKRSEGVMECDQDNVSSKDLASCKSNVSKPSLNQL
jgi:hypothetical protein